MGSEVRLALVIVQGAPEGTSRRLAVTKLAQLRLLRRRGGRSGGAFGELSLGLADLVVEQLEPLRSSTLTCGMTDVAGLFVEVATCDRSEPPSAVSPELHHIAVERNRTQHRADAVGVQSSGRCRDEHVGQRGATCSRGLLRIDGSFPLEAIVDAHRRVDTGHKVGNVLVTIPA